MASSLPRRHVDAALLAAEQGALRRVATLVARGVSAQELFAAVAEELALLLDASITKILRYESDGTATVVGGWSLPNLDIPIGTRLTLEGRGVAVTVKETGRPARTDRFAGPPGSLPGCFERLGARTGVGSPIVVDGVLWGVAVAAFTRAEPLAADSEARISGFTELVATAIANAHAQTELRRVGDDQAALRRVATLVASGASPEQVFSAVAEEVGNVITEADVTLVGRYDSAAIEFVAGWTSVGETSFVGRRVSLGGHNVATLVFERNAPARVDRLVDDATTATALAVEWARSAAGAPIVVQGRLWGVMTVGSMQEQGLPAGIEDRLAEFVELVATAIASAEARTELRALVDEQGTLRHVATLVARGEAPEAVFAAVAEAVGRLLPVDLTLIGRYDGQSSVTGVGGWSRTGDPVPIGTRAAVGGRNVTSLVLETARPARVDSYERASGAAADDARARGIRSSVGAPVSVHGRLWGVVIASSTHDESLPEKTEGRLANFAELVATAIANTQTREELRRVAEEQTALRRVATLVAQGDPPDTVFAAGAAAVGRLLPIDYALVARFGPGATRHDPGWLGADWGADARHDV